MPREVVRLEYRCLVGVRVNMVVIEAREGGFWGGTPFESAKATSGLSTFLLEQDALIISPQKMSKSCLH